MKLDTLLIFLFVALICFGFFIAHNTKTQRNFSDTFLAEEKEELKPEETLIAPFADDHVKPYAKDERKDANLPTNKIPIHLPHRSVKNMREWVTTAVSDSLQLDKDKLSKLNQTIKPYFTDQGFKEYAEFGKTTNIFSQVYYNADSSLVSFLPEPPLNIFSQAYQGVFQWRFEVPVVLNLVKGDLKAYDEKATAAQEQKKIKVCVDVVRIPDTKGEGVKINKWSLANCGIAKGQLDMPDISKSP